MKTLLLALAVAFGIAAVLTHAAPGAMQTVNTLSDLSNLGNPLTVASNTFVVTEGTLGDGTSSIWTFVRGATNTPGTDVIVSSTMPAAGRFIRNTPGGGGNVTNIYNTVVSTNLYITTNVYIMQGSFTNQAGLWELTNGVLQNISPNIVNLRLNTNGNVVTYSSDGSITDETADIALRFNAGTANPISFVIDPDSGVYPFFVNDPIGQYTNVARTKYYFGVPSIRGTPTGVPSLASQTPFGEGGHNILTPITVDTVNNLLYFYSSNAWRSASGAVNGWTLTGGTNVSTAATVSAPEIYTSSFRLNRTALTPVDTGTYMDFSSTNRYWSCSLTGAVTFVITNNIAGQHGNVMLTGVSTNANYTFPANWIFIGYKPTYLSANKHADIYFKSTGTGDANIWAYYGEEQ